VLTRRMWTPELDGDGVPHITFYTWLAKPKEITVILVGIALVCCFVGTCSKRWMLAYGSLWV
jgi:hypothetical protein